MDPGTVPFRGHLQAFHQVLHQTGEPPEATRHPAHHGVRWRIPAHQIWHREGEKGVGASRSPVGPSAYHLRPSLLSPTLYRRRDTYRQKGKALMKEGKKSEAVECFQKCVDVTPEMALAVIKVTSPPKLNYLLHLLPSHPPPPSIPVF